MRATSLLPLSLAGLLLGGLPLSAQPAVDRESRPATLLAWRGEPVASGELGGINTDRPDFTESTSLVGLGVLQVEMGYTFTKAGSAEAHSLGEPLLRYGAFANWV